MEILFKVVYAVVVLSIAGALILSVVSVCRSQVDPVQTMLRWFRKAAPLEGVLSTRDPMAIYQDGRQVGVVTGAVVAENGLTVFHQLSETAALQTDKPFEYIRNRYRVLEIGTVAGLKIVATPTGSTSRNAVLEDVVCQMIP
jgi:hypothetical protein